MTGIEILAAQEVVTEFAFNWTAFWITFGTIFGVCVLVGIIASLYFHNWSNLLFCIILGAILGAFFGAMFGDAVFHTPIAYETQYKVTISDEVVMNEFFEKYEIIDQEGKIYTIRERYEKND